MKESKKKEREFKTWVNGKKNYISAVSLWHVLPSLEQNPLNFNGCYFGIRYLAT